MFNRAKLIGKKLVSVALLCLATHSIQAQTFYCPKYQISEWQGTSFSDTKEIASKYTGYDVGNFEDMRVYVTTKNRILYVQTNYAPQGNPYPLKLATLNAVPDVGFAVKDMLEAFGLPTTGFDRAYKENAKLYVDLEIMNDPKYKNLKFKDAQNVYAVNNEGGSWPTKVIAGELASAPLAKRVLAINDNVYVRVADKNPTAVADILNSRKFTKNDVRLLPLILDNSTISKIKNDTPSGVGLSVPSMSREGIREALSRVRNRTVFVLGHIEKGAFVVLDEGNNEVLKLPVQELKEIGKEFDARIFPFGCESAKTYNGPGTLEMLDSITAVERFNNALNAPTWGAFLNWIGDKNLSLVIDQHVIEGPNLKLKISLHRNSELLAGVILAAVVGSLEVTLSSAPSPEPSATPAGTSNLVQANDSDSFISNFPSSFYCCGGFVLLILLALAGKKASS